MISKKLEEMINKQINAELYSAYLYLSMSAYFTSENLHGFAHWMRVQAQEEVGHAMRLYDYLNEKGGRVVLDTIEKPKHSWSSPLEAFEEAYQHECRVSAMINEIMAEARKESDYATEEMLHWFVREQVEEEANPDTIRRMLKLAEGHTGALFMIDAKLAERKPE
jgi:ferritin